MTDRPRAAAPGAARRAALLTLLALSLFVAACGGGGDGDDKGAPIPAERANQMVALLDLAAQQSSAGTCNGAADKVRRARAVAEGLPRRVDPEVRRNLVDGLDRLDDLVQSECPGNRPDQPEPDTTTETTPTEPVPTESTPTAPHPTQTTPTQTTPTEPAPTQTTPTEPVPTPTTPGNGGTPPGQARNEGNQ